MMWRNTVGGESAECFFSYRDTIIQNTQQIAKIYGIYGQSSTTLALPNETHASLDVV